MARSRFSFATLTVAVLAALLLSACGVESSGRESSLLVEPAAFAGAIADRSRTTINVHVPFEGSIAGTDESIPFDQIAAEVNRLPADRDAPLAIYCKTGRMSAIAAVELDRLGYDDVVELRGGMDAWTTQGFPLDNTRATE